MASRSSRYSQLNLTRILHNAGYSKAETIFTKEPSEDSEKIKYYEFIDFVKESLRDFLGTSQDSNFKSYEVPGLGKNDKEYFDLVSQRYEIYNSPGKKLTFTELIKTNNAQIQKKKEEYHFDTMTFDKIKGL